MKPNEILAALMLKGVKQREIAQKLKVTHVAINHVIYGRGKSRRVQEEIARIIGRDVNEIWPQWAA